LNEQVETYKKRYRDNEAEIVRLQSEMERLKKAISHYEDQKRELEQLNDHWENSARILEFSKNDLEERLYQAEENAIMYKEELDEINHQKEIEVQRLKDECRELREELSLLKSQKADPQRVLELEKALQIAILQQEKLNEELDTPPQSGMSVTQTFSPTRPDSRADGEDSDSHISDESSPQTIRVLARVRPLINCERNSPLTCNASEIVVMRSLGVKQAPQKKAYPFEKVIGPGEDQESVFSEISHSVEEVTRGGKACIIAYGQTGSGKTYTMQGLIERTFQTFQNLCDAGTVVIISCIEIYNEMVRDLLGDLKLSKQWKDALLLSEKEVGSDWNEAFAMVVEATNKRATKSTDLNDQSSRSHAIYTIKFKGRKRSQIQFVDLAGSERVNKSKVKDDV
jgi:hypothetical protein